MASHFLEKVGAGGLLFCSQIVILVTGEQRWCVAAMATYKL